MAFPTNNQVATVEITTTIAQGSLPASKASMSYRTQSFSEKHPPATAYGAIKCCGRCFLHLQTALQS